MADEYAKVSADAAFVLEHIDMLTPAEIYELLSLFNHAEVPDGPA